MKFKWEKNLKIINELISYCYSFGAIKVTSTIETEDILTKFYVEANLPNYTEKDLNKLIKILNTPRLNEVEHYYWHLGGESEIDDELSLIGMMIDEATAEFKDSILKIEVIRKKLF